jgi:hypothetical protein
VNRDSKKKPKPFEAIDFVPGAKRTTKKIDPKALKAQLQLAHAGMLAGLKNKGQQTKRNPRKSPRYREGHERANRAGGSVRAKRDPANRGRPYKKHNQKSPVEE